MRIRLSYFGRHKDFSIETERTHLVTNMCKDKEFDFKDSEVIIGTDQEYSGSYGRVNFLRKVDTKNYNNTIREMLSYKTQDTMLKKGENRFPFDLPLEQDSESAFILSYSVFAKIYDDKTSIDAWNYTEAIRYTSDVVFQLRNNLKSKKSIKFDLRWRDRDKITDIATQETLDYSQTYDLKRKIVLEPGQRLEYYIYALDDK